MEFRQVGRSDLLVSKIGFGCWALSNDSAWGPIDEKEAIKTIQAAIDMGVNFFDTSETYGSGHSESILGKGLEGSRNKVIISTKVSGSHLTPDSMPDAVENCLKRLRTDYIDLCTIHWPNRKIPFEDTIIALKKEQEKGKIRHIGVSNFGVLDLSEITKLGDIIADQLPYNLFWRMIEDRIIEKCRSEQIGIVAYSPLAQGLLTGKFKSATDIPVSNRTGTRLYCHEVLKLAFVALERLETINLKLGTTMAQLSLAWLMKQPGITTVIPGAKNRIQLSENLTATEIELSEDIVEKMREISQPLYEHLGKDPDMWSGNRYR